MHGFPKWAQKISQDKITIPVSQTSSKAIFLCMSPKNLFSFFLNRGIPFMILDLVHEFRDHCGFVLIEVRSALLQSVLYQKVMLC